MTPKSPFSPCFSNHALLFTILVLFTTSATTSPRKVSYADHCNSIVPQYDSTGNFLSPLNFLQIAGDHHFYFRTSYIRKTESDDIIQLGGTLWMSFNNGVNFELSGFWSESTGKMCMVGTGSSYTNEGKTLHPSALFKLYYPKSSNIYTSIVNGTVESLDLVDSQNYFKKIYVLAYAQKNYSYMDFPVSIKDFCSKLKLPEQTRSFEIDSVGSYIPTLVAANLKLEQTSDCSGGRSCYPFSLKNGFLPSSLSLRQISFSKEGKFHTRIELSNDTHSHGWFNNQFKPEHSLVGEGFWDHEKNMMCLVACQALANASVVDCSIGISLWFPLVLTIKSRSHVMGRIWSVKNKSDSGYFDTMSFTALNDYSISFRAFNDYSISAMKYKYSMLDGARRCDAISNGVDLRSTTYPDGSSRQDMSFSMRGSFMRGNANPLSIGDTVFADSFVETPLDVKSVTVWNVSYDISYWFYTNNSSSHYSNKNYYSSSSNFTRISAEGIYNSTNGRLCMVGCMYNGSTSLEDSMDCSILINVQFPPMDAKEGKQLDGTIRSTRQTSDRLYFEPLSFSSYKIYDNQAAESIRRMDIEIIMVVTSLTLSCVFIWSQFSYASKNRDVLSAISITMLVVMTLGYLIPLILNFQDMLIMIQNKRNFFLGSREWMVVKEVTVRVLSLVAFVLLLRLLQVAWSKRCASEARTDFSAAEEKTMKLCLALYFVGALIAWFVQSKSRSHWWSWHDLFSYAGFIFDGFLFPQIMFNLFRRSKEKALSLVFYVGMTVIRIFPHLYDLYRTHNPLPHFQSSYIYASPQVDFYSLSWNIIIPLAGIILATCIFMQQRFGGNYIIPSRLRKNDGYVTIAELGL